MRVGLADIETSHSVVATFSLYPESISHENILQDWFIFCAAFKLLDDKHTTTVSLLDDQKRFKKDVTDDYVVVKTLHDFLSSIDVLVGHNVKKFDLKKFNTRAILNGLPPVPPIKVVDTLTEARKHFAFTSNRLDYLSKLLGRKGKKKTSPGLWLRALKGEKDAIKEMVAYNKEDVVELQAVYLKLRPWMKNHPNSNIYNSTTDSCPKCSSSKLMRNGYDYYATGKRQQYQCKDCGAYSSGELILNSKKIVVK